MALRLFIPYASPYRLAGDIAKLLKGQEVNRLPRQTRNLVRGYLPSPIPPYALPRKHTPPSRMMLRTSQSSATRRRGTGTCQECRQKANSIQKEATPMKEIYR